MQRRELRRQMREERDRAHTRERGGREVVVVGHVLMAACRQTRGDRARGEIVSTAGRKPDDDGDRSVGALVRVLR